MTLRYLYLEKVSCDLITTRAGSNSNVSKWNNQKPIASITFIIYNRIVDIEIELLYQRVRYKTDIIFCIYANIRLITFVAVYHQGPNPTLRVFLCNDSRTGDNYREHLF